MSTIVTMKKAQALLPDLVAHLVVGNEIITEDDQPVARLIMISPTGCLDRSGA